MISIDELCIVNYCHPKCKPFFNICRLEKEKAFALAGKMATDNPDSTAFFRFSDFKSYYPRRMKTDEFLYDLFVSLGGKPKERHPLSFVLQGSEFLNNWFDNGIISKVMLKDIPTEFISFTLGDSMNIVSENGAQTTEIRGQLIMYTKEMLLDRLQGYMGSIDDFMDEIAEKYNYIEVQLWNDDYCIH